MSRCTTSNHDSRRTPLSADTSRYELYGWAADPNAPDQPVTIHLYLNGEFAGQDVTGDPRTDVAAAYPWSGPNTGFSAWVSVTGTTTAPQMACAYAINLDAGSNTTLGCVDLPAPGSDGREPIGSIDEMRVSPGMIHMSGWASDRDARSETVQVRVYYDDTHMLTMRGDQPRPDVATVFPELDDTRGFSYDLPIQPGRHQVCAYAGNLGAGGLQNATLDCRVLDIPDVTPAGPQDPQGNVDALRTEFVNTGYTSFTVPGWTFDPDAAGPWSVRVLAPYVPGIGDNHEDLYPVYIGTGATDQSRPDVQSAFPAAGPSSGYAVPLSMMKYGGYRFACVYARQAGSGTGTERFLGCVDR
ncbi:MAG: hypothetical protein ACSLFB_11310 [Acidimicrobiales bacterium]